MPPDSFIATLSASLAANGSETEAFLSTIQTLTGETITTSQFSTLGRGVITIDPLSSTNIEFASFTGVDATGLGFTGLTRGLSALSNSTVTANKKYHPAGTTVIISFGVHNLLDLQTYITNAVSGSLGTATDSTAGSTKISFNLGSLPRARATLVSQSGSGATNLLVNPFSLEYQNALYGNLPTTANPPVLTAVTTGVFANTTSTNRIDLIVWTTASSPGSVAIRQGVEASTPSAPTPTSGDIVLASVYIRHNFTKVIERDDSTNAYIIQWYEPTVYSSSVPVGTNSVLTDTDQSQTTQNSSSTVGESDATTKHGLLAQGFVPAVNNIRGVTLYKSADTGSFTGTVSVALQADTSGSPSGVNLASQTISNAQWLELTTGAFTISFSSAYSSMTVGSTYWIVVTCSTGDTSNHPNLGINTAGGYASGTLKYKNSTDGWVAISTSILYFKTRGVAASKVVQTDSNGDLPLVAKSYSLISTDATGANVSTSNNVPVLLYKKAIPQDLWGINSGFRVRIQIATSSTSGNGSANIATWTLKYAGSTLFTVDSNGGTSGATGGSYHHVDIYIMNQGAMNSQTVYIIGMRKTTTTGGGPSTVDTPFVGTSSTAIDTSLFGSFEIYGNLNPQVATTPSGQVSYNACVIERIS